MQRRVVCRILIWPIPIGLRRGQNQEGPYTLLAGSAANHAIVGLTFGGRYQLYYDNEASRYVSSANYVLYGTIRTAYAGDDSIGYDMYLMARDFTEPDARTPW